MKWKNKGHEYDEIGQNFQIGKRLFIYGAGENGAKVYKQVEFLDCVEGFIDNDIDKQESGYLGKPVESILDFLKRDNNDFIVIIAGSLYNSPIFIDQLLRQGYRESQNCFMWNRFIDYYLPIYAVYSWDKVYFSSISVLPTSYCNLKCVACLSFTPYAKEKKHRKLEELEMDVDSYFNCVDFTGLFHISEGEPLVYPQLAELITYIGKNYRHKIEEFIITTNGTITPSEQLYEVIFKYGLSMIVDDYSDRVGKKEVIDKIRVELNNWKIPYTVSKVESWIDLAYLVTENSNMGKIGLEDYYNSCSVPYTSLYDEKVSTCNYGDYAKNAGIIEVDEDDYFSLKNHNESNKKELVEFRLGYSRKGYSSFCKQCAGFIAINKNIIPVAEQI